MLPLTWLQAHTDQEEDEEEEEGAGEAVHDGGGGGDRHLDHGHRLHCPARAINQLEFMIMTFTCVELR